MGFVSLGPDRSLVDILTAQPVGLTGVPIRDTGYRFSVEILVPVSGMRWDVDNWDEDVWGVEQFADITEHVRGISWFRGADEDHGRPRIGTASLTLASLNDEFAPWNPTPAAGQDPHRLGPGGIIRWGFHGPGGWLPQFTGIIDDWAQVEDGGNRAERRVEVQVVETLRDVATLELSAYDTETGAGDNAFDRIARILQVADWRFGTNDRVPVTYTPPDLLPTTMEGNALAQVYLAADSGDVEIYSGRDGRATTDARYVRQDSGTYTRIVFGTHRGVFQTDEMLPYDPDTFDVAHNEYHIVNDVELGNETIGAHRVIHETSASRFGKRSLSRMDLVTEDPDDVLVIANDLLDRRARTTLRVSEVQVYPRRDASDVEALEAIAGIDLGDEVAFLFPSFDPVGGTGPYLDGLCRSLRHDITPMVDDVHWVATFAIDTTGVEGLPDAEVSPDVRTETFTPPEEQS